MQPGTWGACAAHALKSHIAIRQGRSAKVFSYPGQQLRQSFEYPSTIVASACTDDILAVTCYDKSIHVHSLTGPEGISWTAAAHKVATKVAISGRDIILADRAGDVYQIRRGEKPQLLLGHVSILTDLQLTGTHIITADRDEKIRVSHWPDAFDIESFCLAHQSYVASTVICGDRLVSVGGDNAMILWDYERGKELDRVDIVPSGGMHAGVDPICVRYLSARSHLIVLVRGCHKIPVFRIQQNKLLRVRELDISPSVEPRDISVHSGGQEFLLVLTSTFSGESVLVHYDCDYQIADTTRTMETVVMQTPLKPEDLEILSALRARRKFSATAD